MSNTQGLKVQLLSQKHHPSMSLSKLETAQVQDDPTFRRGDRMETRSTVPPLRDRHPQPVTTQERYSSGSPPANMIHASLKTSNLPKPQNTSATKLGNVCGSVHSRDRPSAVQKTEGSKGATPKAAALSTRELWLGQLKTTSGSSQKKPPSTFTGLTARPMVKHVFHLEV